jgi:hypothetical protein
MKLVGLLAFAVLIAAGFLLKGCITADTCLDSGGRWNYETKVCEH